MSTMPRTFGDHKNEVEDRLDPHGSYELHEAKEALVNLRIAYPLPPAQIVNVDVCETENPFLRFDIHFTADVDDAVTNINFAGHPFPPSDQYWLQRVLSQIG